MSRQTSRIPLYTHCRLYEGFWLVLHSLGLELDKAPFWLEFCQLQKIIQADRQPKAQQNDNAKENDMIDNETKDDDKEIFTLEDIMNQ